jgi:hypothetical protein
MKPNSVFVRVIGASSFLFGLYVVIVFFVFLEPGGDAGKEAIVFAIGVVALLSGELLLWWSFGSKHGDSPPGSDRIG